MDNKQEPYMPHVAFEMDDFRKLAVKARKEAARLTTEAEIWEEAARRIEYALEKEQESSANSILAPSSDR